MFLEKGIFNRMKLLFELNICKLRLKISWIRINDNWIWDLIKNKVNWDVNFVIIERK